MSVISGRYWNIVLCTSPEEVIQDVEEMQNMRFFVKNFVRNFVVQKSGINMPEDEDIVLTNFIRKI